MTQTTLNHLVSGCDTLSMIISEATAYRFEVSQNRRYAEVTVSKGSAKAVLNVAALYCYGSPSKVKVCIPGRAKRTMTIDNAVQAVAEWLA